MMPAPIRILEGRGVVALTLRECQILAAYPEVGNRKELAARLGMADYTLRNHTQNILAKLGCRRLGQAAVFYDRTQRHGKVERRLGERRTGRDRRTR